MIGSERGESQMDKGVKVSESLEPLVVVALATSLSITTSEVRAMLKEKMLTSKEIRNLLSSDRLKVNNGAKSYTSRLH